jgi:hypothetical protein
MNPDYKPETTDAFINAIPENPYDLCPCGCGLKWRFIVRDNKIEEHAKTFCDKYEKDHTRKI